MGEEAKRQPWIKWYPSDWRADPLLRICSLPARGLWVDLLGYMHESEPYGHLVIANCIPTTQQIAALVGVEHRILMPALTELESRGVFSRDEIGRIYSRRMVRDKAKADADRENGKWGGNPKLSKQVNGGVNPPVGKQVNGVDNGEDKAQKPDTRSHITSKTKNKTASPPAAPPGVRPEVWEAWRRVKGNKLTPDAVRLQTRQLVEFTDKGDDPNDVIEQSIRNTWAGLFQIQKTTGTPVNRQTARTEKRVANIDELTGKTNHERVIEGTSERMDRAAVFQVPGGLREPDDDDVGRLGPEGGQACLG